MTRPTIDPMTAADRLDEVIEYLWTVNPAALTAEEIRDEVLRLAGGDS